MCEAKSIQLLHDSEVSWTDVRSTLPCAFSSLLVTRIPTSTRKWQLILQSLFVGPCHASVFPAGSVVISVTYIDVQGTSDSTHRMLTTFPLSWQGLSFWSLILSLTFAHTPPGSFSDTSESVHPGSSFSPWPQTPGCVRAEMALRMTVCRTLLIGIWEPENGNSWPQTACSVWLKSGSLHLPQTLPYISLSLC